MSRVDQRKSFIAKCKETHKHFSKLSSLVAEHCVLAMVRGLRRALTRIGCLQALEAGPTGEEPCPAEMASYDHVHHDEVDGCVTNLCEEAMQLEIKYMREMDVYTLCTQETLNEQGLTPIGTRWIFTNKGDTEHPLIRARPVAKETKKTTRMDLTDTSMAFAATHLLRDFVFFCQEPCRARKSRAHRRSWSWGSLTSPESTFTRQCAKKPLFECHMVMHHAHQELPCSTVQCAEPRTQLSALTCIASGLWSN